MSNYGDDDDENYNPHGHHYGGAGHGYGQANNPFYAQHQQHGQGFQQMLGGMFGGMGNPGMMGGFGNAMAHGPAPPGAFNKRYKAYSSAIHEIQAGRGNQGAHVTDGGRTQVMFGGQVMLPQSALRDLTMLDIETPYTFEIVHPVNRNLKTHAGVLEFHGDEDLIYMPNWMMKQLELREGDPVRLFGTRLPKGKLVKLQAQSVTFLELSDPKAVLEQALRHYSCLTQGDIIEISYNMMTFSLLVMEISPQAAGIDILNTDLEVDFAPPVGYVEPERKPLAPPPTMASKLSINVGQTQDVDSKGRGSGTSTPSGAARAGSAAGNNAPVAGTSGSAATPGGSISKAGDPWEAFKGSGQSMAGKRIKGKGVSHRKIEAVEADSKIYRTDSSIPRIVTADTQIGSRKVPAALNLPEGTLFFGFKVVPPKKEGDANAERENEGGTNPPAFTGAGQGVTLSGRPPKQQSKAPSSSKSKSGKRDDVIQID